MIFLWNKILDNLVNDQIQKYLITKQKTIYWKSSDINYILYEYFLLRELSPVQVKEDDPL